MDTVEWLFRSRTTGRITVVQWPNAPLLAGIGVQAARWVFDPGGVWRTALEVAGTAAFAVWAADEVVRGVNPWRRLLGGAVLLGLAVSWLRR
ncbi:MAG TPA: hypothetical protein VGO94_02215 [Mycobacteriales bacterium]|jgi:hypothetical protein|nr:hypothetical protein [Mycobacteriales bacterium]